MAENVDVPHGELGRQLEDLADQPSPTSKRPRSGCISLYSGVDEKEKPETVVIANGQTNEKESMDKLMGYVHALPALTATRLFIDWKVFENIPAQGSIAYTDLADKVGADVSLISRWSNTRDPKVPWANTYG